MSDNFFNIFEFTYTDESDEDSKGTEVLKVSKGYQLSDLSFNFTVAFSSDQWNELKGNLKVGLKSGFDATGLFSTDDIRLATSQAEASFTVCECRNDDNQCCTAEETEELSNTTIIIASIVAMLVLVAIVSGFVLCVSAKTSWAVHVSRDSSNKKKKKKKQKDGKKRRVKKEPSTKTTVKSNMIDEIEEPSSSQ